MTMRQKLALTLEDFYQHYRDCPSSLIDYDPCPQCKKIITKIIKIAQNK